MSVFFFATAPKGIEPLLADELIALGAAAVKPTRAGVAFEATLQEAYRICLWSRLASRVIMRLAELDATSSDALYEGVRTVRWNEHMSETGTLAVDFTTHASEQVHTRYGALRVKDAIVDQLRDETGSRPSVDVERPDVRVNVFMEAGRAFLGIDLSGDSLHRRGYRDEGARAPLKENLAAAILTRAAITRDVPLVDPMCGSGTLLVEGAMMLADIAPGIARDYFGFVRWRGHDAIAWEELRREAAERREVGLTHLPPIVGFEPDIRTLGAARDNVHGAGLDKHIRVEKASLATLTHALPAGNVVTNPPYGMRLADDDGRQMMKLYEELGSTLKAKFNGWRAAVLVAQGELAGALRLRGDKRYTFFNGAIPCWLFIYTMADTARVTKTSEGETAFANRLKKNGEKLGKWAKGTGIECYRVYDADIPEYALAIDRYGKWVHVQEYAPPKTVDPRLAARRIREAMHAIPDSLGVDERDVFIKVRMQQKGTTQYERHDSQGEFVAVHEGGYTFFVNLSDYLDTGLFLDHRITRDLVGKMSAGKSFLNLFAYTCTATVYAAGAGATSTVSVDTSRTYLNWAERNFDANQLNPYVNRIVQEDVIAWLHECNEQFDVIFVDPPTFSNSKSREHDFDVQRDHIELLMSCERCLAPNGAIVFSNNYRRFKIGAEELAAKGLHVEDITKKTIPKDFERNARIHQCFILRRNV